MMTRALTKRCPRCGERKIFDSWFRIRERCPACSLVMQRGEGAFLGSLSLNYGVTGAAFIALLVVWLVLDLPDLQFVPLLLSSIGLCLIVPVVFYPFAKTIWSAIELMLRTESDDRPKGA